ncbi:invasin domain 3-containing protein [Aquirufa sp. KTFRIE-69F]|uniref:Invasin domain 3-containing protein n=1 Tax=Aquirufa originis TaxID=3096514 RepID=A0ABW6D5Q4_9BACT
MGSSSINYYFRVWGWMILFFCVAHTSQAQCNVNDPYDKLISGYHASVAIKSTGEYSIWGANMAPSGLTGQLTPLEINGTNYSGISGTIYKAGIGGTNSGASIDQAVVLTSTGLFAWGAIGSLFNPSLTNSAGVAQIIPPTGSSPIGLPMGLEPQDVKMLFAVYRTLVLLSKSGDVYVLGYLTGALDGNGAAQGTTGMNSWQRVKLDATTYLTGVKNVRGQSASANYNAFVAETTDGKMYTWGASTFLGDGTGAAYRSFATEMTLPADVKTKGIKMIGVTGGITGGSSYNTYYVLSNSGNLYAMGDNKNYQCGDFSRDLLHLDWVQAKKSSAPNDFLTNVIFVTVQEHSNSVPAASAITKAGDLYSWGYNARNMLGRPIENASYDPGLAGGFNQGTDKALFAEMGGHTLLYVKEGSSKFCYVGHRINGSMGDGTSFDAKEPIFNCDQTPTIDLCGSVPNVSDSTTSTINASPKIIKANNKDYSTIFVQLKDFKGNNLTGNGGLVTISSTLGTVSAVVNNNNGTYTAILTGGITAGTAIVSFTINGSNAVQTDTVTILPYLWPGEIASDQSLCYPAKPSPLTSKTDAYGVPRPITYVWQQSLDNISFTQIPGATAKTYTPPLSKSTIYYRRGARSSIDSLEFTNSVVIRTEEIAGGKLTGTGTFCGDKNSQPIKLSGHIGTISKWQSADTPDFLVGVADIANTDSSYTATNLPNTKYFRAVITQPVCGTVYSSGTVVVINPIPSITFVPNPAQVVRWSSLTITASGADRYAWSPRYGLSAVDKAVVIANPIKTTTYSIKGTNNTGCNSTTSLTVTVLSAGTLDTDGDGIYDEDEENPLKYKPDCDGDGIENRLDPDPCPFFEPQGISPNGDGKNDFLIFEGLLTKPIPNHISIFDRVGSLVYETDNYQNNWAGETSKGTSLFEKTGSVPDGTYYYILDFYDQRPTVKNFVYVLRNVKK